MGELRRADPDGGADGNLAAAYTRLLAHRDPSVREHAAVRWCEWEDTHVSLTPGWTPDARYRDPSSGWCSRASSRTTGQRLLPPPERAAHDNMQPARPASRLFWCTAGTTCPVLSTSRGNCPGGGRQPSRRRRRRRARRRQLHRHLVAAVDSFAQQGTGPATGARSGRRAADADHPSARPRFRIPGMSVRRRTQNGEGGDPALIVLVLPGGKASDRRRSKPWQAADLRMSSFTRTLRRSCPRWRSGRSATCPGLERSRPQPRP